MSPSSGTSLDWTNPGRSPPVRRFAPATAPAALTDLAFSPDGDRFATASKDGTVRVWLLDSETPLAVIQPKAGAALGVTFSPKGTYLLTSWTDGKFRLYRRDGDDYKPGRRTMAGLSVSADAAPIRQG